MKIKRILLMFLLTFSFITLISCEEVINPLDIIHNYEIKIKPRHDGTLDMHFSIDWCVLDDTSEGPLEWIKIGIPNYHVDEIKGLSNNIKSIDYDADDGAFIRIDFKKKYYKGDVLTIEFQTHQAYMYTYDQDYCYYEYIPGWFDEIKVKKAVVLWAKDGVIDSNANETTEEYLKWEYTLDYGEKIQVGLKYNVNYFNSLIKDEQYSDDYLTPGDKIGIIIFIIILIGIIVTISIVSYTKQDPYLRYRGFCGHRVYYYRGYPHYYFSHHLYTRGVNKKGDKIVNPSDQTWHSSGRGGSSCACACACACAGGGRAGCSRKDFNHHSINTEQILSKLDEKKSTQD